jgi:Domain of unknown function (DUF4055)
MPVDSTHPDYDASLPSWLRARDVFAGEDAVKAAGEKYLPRLDCQDDKEYLAYKNRASFFNASARTADGFVGLIFRRDPTFKLPDDRQSVGDTSGRSHLTQRPHPQPLSHPMGEGSAGLSPKRRGSVSGVAAALSEFVQDADMLGTSLTAFTNKLVTEIIKVGRAGTLVDWNEEAEQRAYAVAYAAEDIINWHTERVNGRNVLTLVVLKEVSQKAVAESDPFEPEEIQQLRVLKLVERRGPGVEGQSVPRSAERSYEYQVEIWQFLADGQNANGVSRRGKRKWRLVDTLTPLRLGKPLPLIPFVFHGPRHSLPDVDKIPLADIVAINLDHYRLNADYKHGMHFTALPTAWVSGFDKNSPLRIGSSTAWVAETPGATAGFLEFHGQGLTTFERAMDRDEQLMAVLGTRMLESQKRVGETAAAIELRQSGENSILNTVSLSVSASLTQVLRWVYWWNSTEPIPDAIGPDLVLATLNTDFSITGMSFQEITALVAAWQAGAISQDTMFELFRAGEVIAPGRTNEEELALLASEKRNTSPRPSPQGGGGAVAPAGAEKQPVSSVKNGNPQPIT